MAVNDFYKFSITLHYQHFGGKTFTLKKKKKKKKQHCNSTTDGLALYQDNIKLFHFFTVKSPLEVTCFHLFLKIQQQQQI